MIEITKRQIRPSKDIPFYFEVHQVSEQYRNYMIATYIKTGKLIESKKIMSEDLLTVDLVSVWNNEEDFLSLHVDDTHAAEQSSTAYDLSNNIKTTVSSRKL